MEIKKINLQKQSSLPETGAGGIRRMLFKGTKLQLVNN